MQKNFSCLLKIDELNQQQYKFVLKPDADELADITEILQVEGVKDFVGEIFLKLNKKEHILRVWGKVSAKVLLKSVISLEDFWKEIQAPFELIYDTKATYKDIHEMEQGINDEVPDIIENGVLNLADICLEQIALNLEDYPRAQGEEFHFTDYSEQKTSEKENPFAVLGKLKK
ncbi:MAG: DUF177 domain-containing protein [Alphaproteobacteria bacterium]|nr:DUF177 domain-containing protein [Alphaproteobacteria bacterium]